MRRVELPGNVLVHRSISAISAEAELHEKPNLTRTRSEAAAKA